MYLRVHNVSAYMLVWINRYIYTYTMQKHLFTTYVHVQYILKQKFNARMHLSSFSIYQVYKILDTKSRYIQLSKNPDIQTTRTCKLFWLMFDDYPLS